MSRTLDEVMTTEESHRYGDCHDAACSSQTRNALRAELREPLRALRESHDALRDSLQEFAEGPWHNSKCAGWSENTGETEYDMRTRMRPELCDCAISRARAALEKAQQVKHG